MIISSYDSAKLVSALWIVSAILPLALVPTKEHGFQLMNAGAIVVFGLAVFGLTWFVRKRVLAKRWALSDAVAYIVVPAALFMWTTAMMLSTRLPG